MGAVFTVAVVGYVWAGWAWDDAVYMVVITVFGVGYQEVQPIDSPRLRWLTISVIVVGYGSVIYTVGGFIQMLIDGELNKVLGARRMTREIERLVDHTIICGAGRLGVTLANELASMGKPFVLIDSDSAALQDPISRGYLCLHGDASEEETLDEASIAEASTVAAVLSNDATNVFVTITARDMNANVNIIARGEDPRTERKLISSGASRVILPTSISAHRVAQLIRQPSAESMLNDIRAHASMVNDLDHMGLSFDELVVDPESPLVNQCISDIEVRSNHGFLIVGLRHADGRNELNPDTQTRLQAGDTVIVLGYQNDIPELARRFGKKEAMVYRGVSLDPPHR